MGLLARQQFVFPLLAVILLTLSLSSCKKDPCLNLEPCEQYSCLNPEFYCATTLYESGKLPRDMASAQTIVEDYVTKVLQKTGEVGFSGKTRDPYHWYQVTFSFSDCSQYGYEVGPDGNIYEIKRLN